ncbi:uncharacterized protein A1O5_05693 [Cladophialophora psammophila CBS 110553]|uniref:Uncharacterized protein n=1 Tax=Cladophialophora psammophila CBS 110553 TaxID=1182543 RepID=W9WRZ2_9EURO|nr:uncharacterized protein A1O5_05693 [Cladophialophora psammophila CBS 110553]EXJ70703.1 hypothetical protein A1O5_05693 [Cladophialophora psammophila CBS 110553]
MPPKRITVQPARRSQPKGWFGQMYHTLTSEENASVVISVAMFGTAPKYTSVVKSLSASRYAKKARITPDQAEQHCRLMNRASAAAVAFFNSEWSEMLLPGF